MYKNSEEEICLSSICEALEVIGGKWAFLILGHLNNGPQRFNQLRRNLGNISTKSLTDTLRHLEQNEVIHREVFPTVPVTVEYSLTNKGKDFQIVLIEMLAWGQKWRNKKTVK
jgi:DNA-binding HxlR family transcriptional regulator